MTTKRTWSGEEKLRIILAGVRLVRFLNRKV